MNLLQRALIEKAGHDTGGLRLANWFEACAPTPLRPGLDLPTLRMHHR